MRVLIVDSETGGFEPGKHSCLEVGWVVGDLDTGEILDHFGAYNKLASIDDYVVTPEAFAIHKISPQMCMDSGIPAEEIRDKMLDHWVEYGCTHIGFHNGLFDIQVLASDIFKCPIPAMMNGYFVYYTLDTQPIIRLLQGHKDIGESMKLEQLAKKWKLVMPDKYKGAASGHHAAVYDAAVTFTVMAQFRKVLTDLPLRPIK